MASLQLSATSSTSSATTSCESFGKCLNDLVSSGFGIDSQTLTIQTLNKQHRRFRLLLLV